MNISNFVSPLETLQVISIFSYLNKFSDFLYAENCLSENDLNKPIPVVNALYNYLLDEKYSTLNRQDRKLKVVRRLIKGSDLYGGKDDEHLDLYFVNKMINHIVDSLVFEKFSNVYGFIAEVIRSSDTDSLNLVLHRIKKTLIGLTFENQYGDDSQLEPQATEGIFRDLILPLFPQLTYNDMYAKHLSSVDYIYAQAGSAFIRSGQTQTELVDDSNKFQEYIQVAHTVEELVVAKKLDDSALNIFALPALINYVFKERKRLQGIDIVNIINRPHYWKEAYTQLFIYLNSEFSSMEELQEQNNKYQFYAAMTSYNNRTTMAREAIEINCPTLTDSEMEEEIKKYKNNHDDYKCKGGSENKLDDLNKNFQELVDNIANKYFIFEKESCRAAFGADFIKSMDNTNVEISRGLIRYYYAGSVSPFATNEVQLVKKENDLFQFYFPDSDTYSYYALVRNGYHVSMIKEAGNSTLFREAIGLESDQDFRSNFFPAVLKAKSENFESFLTKIANERKRLFTSKLQSGYDPTGKEQWIEFGMSLIPFYTCVKDIQQGKAEEASLICPIDAALIVPVIGEIGYMTTKISQAISKSVFTLIETTMRTMTLRTVMRTALRITGRVVMDEVQNFNLVFSKEAFKELGISVFRLVDPGFELAFTIGKGGLRSMKTLTTLAARKLFVPSPTLNAMLEKATKIIDNFPKTIGKKFGKDVYVNCITGKEFGYGYKFVTLKSGKVAELRTISNKEVALVSKSSAKEKIYNEVNLETEELIGKDYFIDEEDKVSEARTFEMHFQEQPSEVLVENGNFLRAKVKSFIFKNKVFSDAVNLARREGFLPESTIRNELKNYAFPETGRTEVNFVSEWIRGNELKAPAWAEEFRVAQPELYFQLKYKEVLENPRLTASEAIQRINALYPTGTYAKIREELPVESVFKDFMKRHAYKYVRYEDYYALRYYGGSGYLKMAGSSDEANRMKNAIYRLAIRQAEYPEELYARRLVRGESRITEAIEKELADKKTFKFNRFTSVSTDVETAVKYSQKGDPTQTRVFYDMKFDEPMIRARVEHLFVKDEKETILLPGTTFNIDKIERSTELTDSGVRRNVIKVHLTHLSSAEPKVQRLNEIMKEIDKLMATDTKFYAENLPIVPS